MSKAKFLIFHLQHTKYSFSLCQMFTNSFKLLQLLLFGHIEEQLKKILIIWCVHLFLLPWRTAVARRNAYKAMLFSDTKLILINQFVGSKDFQWEFVHGLFENAIYGGRVDNFFDMRVLRSYLEQLFNSRIIGSLNTRSMKMSTFPCSISLPNSCSILVGTHLLSPKK